MSSPIVSVLIPVYNGGPLLADALRSVYAQEIDGLEIIVLDDGSSDGSSELVAQMPDPRCICVRHPNRGLAATLNRGIALARGRYIARQDQDDIVLPGRLAHQLAFLEAHPEIGMVGTWSQIYEGDRPSPRQHRHPSSNAALQLELLFDNPFVHSSMMIRAEVLRELGGYCEDKSRQPPEDYELWSRIARRHKVANLPEVLTIYRELPGSMSRAGESPFLEKLVLIGSENLAHVLPDSPAEQLRALAELYHCGGRSGFRPAIKRVAACNLFEQAACAIGGPAVQWSAEFRASYQRMRKHIEGRYMRQRVPARLLAMARGIKHRLKYCVRAKQG
ncbi:MAG TPA: glycosyl transferase [Oxalobacteraceae bacterium]|nr:glycosyl transferase [Oxalobacteraceae bacterium]